MYASRKRLKGKVIKTMPFVLGWETERETDYECFKTVLIRSCIFYNDHKLLSLLEKGRHNYFLTILCQRGLIPIRSCKNSLQKGVLGVPLDRFWTWSCHPAEKLRRVDAISVVGPIHLHFPAFLRLGPSCSGAQLAKPASGRRSSALARAPCSALATLQSGGSGKHFLSSH